MRALVLTLLLGLGTSAAAETVDWSSYLEPPGTKTKVESKSVDLSKVVKTDAKPAKAAKVAKKTSAPKKVAAKPKARVAAKKKKR
jgi:hypothetical protein